MLHRSWGHTHEAGVLCLKTPGITLSAALLANLGTARPEGACGVSSRGRVGSGKGVGGQDSATPRVHVRE